MPPRTLCGLHTNGQKVGEILDCPICLSIFLSHQIMMMVESGHRELGTKRFDGCIRSKVGIKKSGEAVVFSKPSHKALPWIRPPS